MTQTQTYILYHTKPRRGGFGTYDTVFPHDFNGVAVVTANDLEGVFERTNHSDHNWTDNEGVVLVPIDTDANPLPPPRRSTSVGDVIAAPDGLYVVRPVGFDKLDGTNVRDGGIVVPAAYA